MESQNHGAAIATLASKVIKTASISSVLVAGFVYLFELVISGALSPRGSIISYFWLALGIFAALMILLPTLIVIERKFPHLFRRDRG